MAFSKYITLTLVSFTLGAAVEQHTISFQNGCGFGVPTLVQNGKTLVTGSLEGTPYTTNGPVVDFTAFLQADRCGTDGEGCTVVKGSLQGTSSFANVTTAAPFGFTFPTGYEFFAGCDGLGFSCTEQECSIPADTNGGTQLECTAPNVDLVVTFCVNH